MTFIDFRLWLLDPLLLLDGGGFGTISDSVDTSSDEIAPVGDAVVAFSPAVRGELMFH